MDREHLARYGLVSKMPASGQNAIGGDNVSTVVLGQERYRVNVRFQRDFRSTLGRSALSRPAGGQRQVPLSELAQISIATDRPCPHENGLLTGYVYVDSAAATGRLCKRSESTPADHLNCPPATRSAGGQYRPMQRVRAPEVGGANHTCCDLPASVHQHEIDAQNNHRFASRSFFRGGASVLYLAGYNMSILYGRIDCLAGIDAEQESSCSSTSIWPTRRPSAKIVCHSLAQLREPLFTALPSVFAKGS